MGSPLSKALALATGMAIALIAPATAAPMVGLMFEPGAPTAQSDVVRVRDSARTIHRGRLENGGGAWKKRRHHRQKRHERRHDARDFDGRPKLYRPRETPKYAYDGYGNYRVHDGNRWDDGGWDGDGWDRDWDRRDWDRRDWDKKLWKRPHTMKNSFGYREPSPALKDVLTAVPD